MQRGYQGNLFFADVIAQYWRAITTFPNAILILPPGLWDFHQDERLINGILLQHRGGLVQEPSHTCD